MGHIFGHSCRRVRFPVSKQSKACCQINESNDRQEETSLFKYSPDVFVASFLGILQNLMYNATTPDGVFTADKWLVHSRIVACHLNEQHYLRLVKTHGGTILGDGTEF